MKLQGCVREVIRMCALGYKDACVKLQGCAREAARMCA